MPFVILLAAWAFAWPIVADESKPRTMQQVLEASKPSDWRALDPMNSVYLDLDAGRVVIELAPAFAPKNVANVKALVAERFFDGLWVMRVQDNYVTQWGDPDSDDPAKAKAVKAAKATVAAEFERPVAGLPSWTALPDGDVYAPEVGFVDGMPAARDPREGVAWLAHCYAMVGAGRGNDADSGGGRELYVNIGHAPRHLDRNVTLLGRVVQGMDLLSSLPRGAMAMGYYEKPGQRLPIRAMRLAADLPENERVKLEVLRTDTPTFAALVESRRNRRDEWFKRPAGRIDVCNVPIPARKAQ
jgi:peptidylprolyl isomerase